MKDMDFSFKGYIEDENYPKNVSKLKSIVIKYDKNEVLGWLSAIGIFPGNEIYSKRFEFLIYLVSSIEQKKFLGEKVSRKSIKEILEITERLNWFIIEDYKPPVNSKRQIFGLNSKEYNYFHGNLDDPIGILKNISNRFFDFDKKIKRKLKYSPLNELERLLIYQTKLIKFIDSYSDNYESFKKIRIPKNNFLGSWFRFLEKNKNPFSENFSKDFETKEFKNLDGIGFLKSLEELVEKPIFDGKIYTPWSLIESFRNKLLIDASKSFNKEDDEIIKGQLLLDIFENLAQLVPKGAIITRFKINDIDFEMDFGIIFDDNFFIINVIEEIFSDKNSDIKKMNEIQESFIKVQKELESSNFLIKHEKYEQRVEKKVEPYFMVILDDIKPKNLIGTKRKQLKNFFLIPKSCFEFVIEDLYDDLSKDLGYLSKVFQVFTKLEKELRIICLNFCDFYEMLKGYPPLTASVNFLYVDPNSWSYSLHKKYLESPKFDYRPENLFAPHTFKTRKIFENTYLGRNHLLDIHFYVFHYKNIQIYFLFNKEIVSNKMDMEAVQFLGQLFTFFLEDFRKKGILEKIKSKKIVNLIPIDFAIKNKIFEGKTEYPMIIGKDPENGKNFLMIFNSEVLPSSFDQFPKKILESIIHLLDEDIGEIEKKKILKRISNINPKKFFKISSVSSFIQVENRPHMLYPTIIDEIDLQFEKGKFIRENFSPGIYKRDRANEIIRKIYFHLVKGIKKILSNYQIKDFIEFAYRENENSIKTREILTLRGLHAKNLEINYDPFEELREQEELLRWYSPCCRYLLEQRLAINESGNKKISINAWRTLVPLAREAIELSNLSEFVYYAPKYLDIKVKINPNVFSMDLIVNESPFSQYFKEYMEGFKERKIEYANSVKKDPEVPIKKILKNHFKNKSIGEVSELMKNHFGFSLEEYSEIVTRMTYLEEKSDSDGLIRTNKEEIVKFITNRWKINKKTIEKVLDFLTLSSKNFDEELEPHKVTSRENRLLIKPIIKLDKELIIGINTFNIFVSYAPPKIAGGDWIYSKELIPKDLMEAIDKVKYESSREFENYIYNRVKKNVDFCQKNICQVPGKNSKCFLNILEPCPGQIDVISLEKERKRILIWEAKDIGYHLGGREITNQIEQFEENYIKVLKEKENYVRRNLKSILEYFKIKEYKDWAIETIFVLSNLSPIKFLLSKNAKIIIHYEIDKFLK